MISNHPLKNYKETLGCSSSTPLEKPCWIHPCLPDLAGPIPDITSLGRNTGNLKIDVYGRLQTANFKSYFEVNC
jgi:hypothetical protein